MRTRLILPHDLLTEPLQERGIGNAGVGKVSLSWKGSLPVSEEAQGDGLTVMIMYN